jgi:hypothetical protein
MRGTPPQTPPEKEGKGEKRKNKVAKNRSIF